MMAGFVARPGPCLLLSLKYSRMLWIETGSLDREQVRCAVDLKTDIPLVTYVGRSLWGMMDSWKLRSRLIGRMKFVAFCGEAVRWNLFRWSTAQADLAWP